MAGPPLLPLRATHAGGQGGWQSALWLPPAWDLWFNGTPCRQLPSVLHGSVPAGPWPCWEGVGCVPRGWRGWVCLGPLLRAFPCPRCRLPWAGCRQAALSRQPSRTLHFSVWCETVAVINLTGALRAEHTAQLVSLHQWVGAGAPSPSPPLLQHPSSCLPAVLLSTHPALEQLQGQCLFCQRCFPPQSSVSGVGSQPVAAFPKVSASAMFCLLPISVFC